MGKKSSEKKQRREQQEQGIENGSEQHKSTLERVLVEIIRFATYCALFTPLFLSVKFYFPFVGPKSLYLMGGCQIVFFAWLILAIYFKKYRPKLNVVLLALVFFLFVMLLSSVFGIDFSRSFWSKYERMTGLLVWLHLFGFFLAVSCTFKKESDWKKIFTVSIFVSVLVSINSLLERQGIEPFVFSPRGGATLGNSSFLGTYLMFNVFLALYLFFRGLQLKRLDWKSLVFKAIPLLAVFLGILAMYYEKSQAALLSTLGGFVLIFLLWLSFKFRYKIGRVFGKVLLAFSVLLVIAVFIMLFQPESFVHQKFASLVTRARFVNWNTAWQGFLEHKWLGWGPENYTVAFTKFFNPCLFIPEDCGGEIWFDRSHNIVFDTLVTTGILGFISYLGLFAVLFYLLGRKYFKEKTIDFWTFAFFATIPIAYFIQNLTVFDMATSLMMFTLTLGFVGFLASLGKEKAMERKFVLKHRWPIPAIAVIFALMFFEFVIQPFRADALVIKALSSLESPTRVELYNKTLETSPLGKYQIREFFAQHTHDFILNNFQKMPKEDIVKELDFVAETLKQSKKESPLDYRSVLKLAHVYNIFGLIDQSQLALAEKYGQESIELSPVNQQGYWALAQTKVYQGDFEAALSLAKKAIEFEPRWLQSHKIAIRIAQRFGEEEKAKEVAENALAVALEQIALYPKELVDYQSRYQSAVEFAEIAGNEEKMKETASSALELALKQIDNSPETVRFYQLAFWFGERIGNEEKLKQAVQEMLTSLLEQIELYPERLGLYQEAVKMAQKLGDAEQAIEIARKAINFNADWIEHFKDILGGSATTDSNGLDN